MKYLVFMVTINILLICFSRLEHSLSLLITHKKFKINGKWHTWIDYDKFNSLVLSGEDFDGLDYACETPEWAVYGGDGNGFSPNEVRYRRNKRVVEEGKEE